MKKKLESELISIAHRVLKLKNRSETKQLQEETKKLYDQLTVLRFYEENIEIVEKEISLADLEAKLENLKVSDVIEKPLAKEIVETLVVEELVEETIVEEEIEIVTEAEEEVIEEMALVHEEDFKQPQSVLFEDVFGSDFSEPDFVKVNDVPVEVEQVAEMVFDKVEDVVDEDKEDVVEELDNVEPKVAEEVLFEAKKEVFTKEFKSETVFEEAKSKSLNDKLTRGINIGLNDRIAFEKKLFGGSSDDFNRVLSQLNTFDSFDEVNGFINDFVKPDYNNWEGKEEYENRFLEIVEKKFN
jgi:hypothetical protein